MQNDLDCRYKGRMGYKSNLILLFTSAALLTASCGQPTEGPVVDAQSGTGSEMVTVDELGRLLGLRVTEATSTHITLKNSANTVLIFTISGARVYVNTKPVAQTGKVDKSGGQVRVSRSLVSKIRPALQHPAGGPEPVLRRLSGCVVIDAGHGGKDPGARSVLGFYEKNINLTVASKVARLLSEKGLRVRMTRSGDSFIELEERAAIANRLKADLFVSIHADSFPKSSRRGYTMYVARAASRSSFRAAGAIGRSMSRTGLASHGTQTADFRVLTNTQGPAVLVEMGYLTNRREAALLKDPYFQNRIAQAIADGVLDYFS
ncbi:MAG: N-acetylmuramoyl-L-alanine amidase family protein [Planctomycetota bacterium]